jgi:hypothetical protein
MHSAAHGKTGAEYHRPHKTNKDNFLRPGKWVPYNIPEKNLQNKGGKHKNKG